VLGWVFNATPWPLYSQESYPVPTVQEAAWSAGPVIVKGGMKVMSPIFFLRNYSQTYIEVYIYYKYVIHKVAISFPQSSLLTYFLHLCMRCCMPVA